MEGQYIQALIRRARVQYCAFLANNKALEKRAKDRFERELKKLQGRCPHEYKANSDTSGLCIWCGAPLRPENGEICDKKETEEEA